MSDLFTPFGLYLFFVEQPFLLCLAVGLTSMAVGAKA